MKRYFNILEVQINFNYSPLIKPFNMCNLFNSYCNMSPCIYLIILIILWDIVWKIIAMWRSARNNQPYWFISIIIFNTIGILPIIYLILDKKKKKAAKTSN